MILRLVSTLTLALAVFLSGCGDTQDEERLLAAGPNPSLEALLKVANVDAGKKKFRQCAACHSIVSGGMDKGGPNLYGAYDKVWGTNSKRFGYTGGLINGGQKWDAENLDAWMRNPAQLIPKTSMQFSGVPNALDRADIIAYMRSQSPQSGN